MNKKTFVLTIGVVLLSIGVTFAFLINAQVGASSRGQGSERIRAGDYRLSGPYTHKNLTVFLIHGNDQVQGESFLTLQEALEQKKVVVYETQDVNELAIENRSNEDVYVQSGDIVKGGQQDRMLAVDLIVPPKSGKLPIAAFCVESGRWSKRGTEQTSVFTSSADAAATKDLKLAAKRSNSQSEVWENVAVVQEKLSQNVGTRVNSVVSESSLQLSVENRQVQANAGSYVRALTAIPNNKRDVVGYAFAINGKLNSADVYASSALFRKLWPKMLKASAVEAVAELQPGKRFESPKADHLRTFLGEAEKGEAAEREVTPRVKLITREDANNIFFETRDRAKKDTWIHRNYIKKD